ncbi:unnamed protein product [Natator depressus]
MFRKVFYFCNTWVNGDPLFSVDSSLPAYHLARRSLEPSSPACQGDSGSHWNRGPALQGQAWLFPTGLSKPSSAAVRMRGCRSLWQRPPPPAKAATSRRLPITISTASTFVAQGDPLTLNQEVPILGASPCQLLACVTVLLVVCVTTGVAGSKPRHRPTRDPSGSG